MIRNNQRDINTPERYDELYFGDRADQLLEHPLIISKLTKLNVGGRVLDIGCGVGRYFHAFEGCDIHGTELSTKAAIQALKVNPRATLSQWYAGSPLPYPNEYFDLVWCGEFLEHVEDPKGIVNEVDRVLKVGGKALFVTPIEMDSACEEHLWFFDRKDIEEMFADYKVTISTFSHNHLRGLGKPTRFSILMEK